MTDSYIARPISNDAGDGTLRDALHQAFGRLRPSEVRIATAYLTPDGFLALRSGLEQAESVLVLLGERPFLNRRGPSDVFGQDGDEELRGPAESINWYDFLEGGYPWLLLTHEERAELLSRGEDPVASAFDLSAWERVCALVGFLERGGVEVRRYLGADAGMVAEGAVLDHRSPHARLHAKSYLLGGSDGRFTTVGSSNLTKAGLEHNIELNLASSDAALAARLEDWFDGKWAQGQDCTREFIERLEECVLFGRRYTPWQVFIKSLHAAYGRFLDLGLSEDITGLLADFQQDAVQRCVALLERHWGVMLCDSVGLGKTFEGLGILSEFARRREGRVRALVICPAQLVGNWSHDRFTQYGIVARTVSMESLPRLVDLGEIEDAADRTRRERLLRHYQDYDVVLVDESHNFRNSQTKRYRVLMEILRGGKQDKRLVLMTATPINNSVWDLYSQLMLIARGDDAWWEGRGPVPNLRNAFHAVEQGLGGAGLLDTMLLSLVRRTRHDIRARQEAGESIMVRGQPMRFPEHEIPRAIGYSLQQLYSDIYREVIDAVENLHFAVYQLELYGVETEAGESQAQLSQRSANLVGIMRTILLKRMESSVSALTSTVRSMAEYHDLFLALLDEGEVVTSKQAHRLRAVLGGSLQDAELDPEEWNVPEALRELRPAPANADQARRLRAHADADRRRLRVLLEHLDSLSETTASEGDPKVQAVRSLIERLPSTDAHGLPSKVVIFTNYEDTAEYLFGQFGGGEPSALRTRSEPRARSNLSDRRWVSLLTGSDSHRRREAVIERFAPLAAHRSDEPLDDVELRARVQPLREQSIELLIATDVLSEGQNLQDAQYLVNYDLPWNPVRLIQRAGRIDRLNSPHERVFIHNVMPEQGLEDLLNLVRGLTRKLETIEEAVALDASVLGEQIEARELDRIMAIRAGGEQAEQAYREGERTQGLDAALEGLNEYLDIMRETATGEVREVPDGVYSVRAGPQSGVYLMLRLPEGAGGEVFWRWYPLGDTTHPETSPGDVIERIAVTRDEPRHDLPDEENPFRHLEQPLQAAVQQVGDSWLQTAAAQSADVLTRNLKRLLQRDDLLDADPELWRRFWDWADQPQPSDAARRPAMRDHVRTISQLRRSADLDAVRDALAALWTAIEAEGLDRPLPRPERHEPSLRDLELVAWELIVGPDGLGTIGSA